MTPFATGLDHSTLPMPPQQEETARAFYTNLLRLAEVPKPPTLIHHGGVWYQFPDGRQLHLQVDEDFRPMERPHPAIRVQEIDALAEILTAAGKKVEWDQALAPRKRFYTFDPFGNRIEIIDCQ